MTEAEFPTTVQSAYGSTKKHMRGRKTKEEKNQVWSMDTKNMA